MPIRRLLRKKENREQQAVFFDLDETLIKNNIPVRQLFPHVFSDFKDQIGVDNRRAFFDVLRIEIQGLWENMFTKNISPEQQLITCFITALNNTQAIDPTKTPHLAKEMVAHFITLGSRNVELHDGAIEALVGLRKKGITTGIITNGLETLQTGKIKQLQLDQYIDNITISAQAGAHKPDTKIFNLALSKAQTTPDRAWFVGDHVTNDVAGAIRAGMRSVYYNPHNIHVEKSFAGVIERPNYTINHLNEILEYVL